MAVVFSADEIVIRYTREGMIDLADKIVEELHFNSQYDTSAIPSDYSQVSNEQKKKILGGFVKHTLMSLLESHYQRTVGSVAIREAVEAQRQYRGDNEFGE